MKKKTIILVLVWIVLLSVCLVAHADEIQDSILIKAKIVTNHGIENIEKDGKNQSVQKLTIRIEEGEYEGEEHEMEYILTRDNEGVAMYQPLKEKSEIFVTLQQKEGEINEVTYHSTIKNTTIFWIWSILLIVILFVIAREKGIKPFLTYAIFMLLSFFVMMLGINYGWNLIVIASVLSLIITIIAVLNRNGVKKEAFLRCISLIIAIAVMGIFSWVVYDLMKFADIDIKITQNFVNIKELICSMVIFLSCGAANVIDMIFWLIETNHDKFYKKKSDNIIEGQRSLKL